MAKRHKEKAKAAAGAAPAVPQAEPAAIDVAQLREHANELLEAGKGQEVVDTLLSALQSLTTEHKVLAEELGRQKLRVKKLLLLIYGAKSEKLSKEELQQLVLAFGGTEEQANQEEPTVPRPESPDEERAAAEEQKNAPNGKKKRQRRARMTLSPDVERVVTEVAVPAEERQCAHCHQEMTVIGHVEHETIEYIPAKLLLHVERCEKLACRRSDCRSDICTAARAQQESPRRRVDASFLAHLVEAKCEDALPIDRQRDQLSRLGLSVPLNTLYSYWTYVTTLLVPIAQVALARVLADNVVGLDDTKLQVLDKHRPKGSYKGCLWCFTGLGPLVAYTFTESWEAEAIAPCISVIDGFIQCDDYKGYGSEVQRPDGSKRILVPPERRLACMMHVRRRFHEALKLGDTRAARPIELIANLYEVERQAKELGLDAEARLALRTARSLSVLQAFEAWVDDMAPKCTPKSPLASAIGYAQHQRPFIGRCFTDGRFELDNGRTERALRRLCIGRGNFLFTGSAEAAERLASAYTLVQSCRNVGISTRDYLIDVILKLEAGWPMRRIAELVPDQWARLHGPLAQAQQAAQ